MRTLRGGNSKAKLSDSKEEKNGTKNSKPNIDDDDVGANGDDTTDDEGGVDTPPPPPDDDDDSKGEDKADLEENGDEAGSKDTEKEPDEDKPNDNIKKKSRDKGNKKAESGSEDDEEYEVEQIVDMEIQKRKKCPVSFRVRWQGFTEKDDSWLPASELNCDELVQDFLEISGRKSEYERAFESKKRSADSSAEGYRQSSRKTTKVTYSELDEDQDEILPSGTRTRKIKTKAEKKEMPNFSTHKKKSKKKMPNQESTKSKRPQEHFEVEAIVDQRIRGKIRDYKIRWKGFSSKHDSWLPEWDLNCPALIKAFKKKTGNSKKVKVKEEEKEYEVESIQGMRQTKGRIEYKVRWKNWGKEYDSWLPEDEMNCPEILDKFNKVLDKLEKQTDWQVEKILDSRERRGKKEYLIHWQGFDSKCDTWEPEENLQGCKDILNKFNSEQKKNKDKLLKAGRKTRDDRPRPERYVENFTGGSRSKSKRRSAGTSYSEFYDE